MNRKISRKISIAPLMGYTDRHYRTLMRQMTRHTLLYTEMMTTGALLRGKSSDRLLAFSPEEHPIAIQLGGTCPKELALCARIADEKGYDEVNLNVGCPSGRATAGRFGVCLLKEPEWVADCVAAMQAAVKIPVSVKTRIGVDDYDDYAHLYRFVKTVSAAGCGIFIIHARKAWLEGLSPAENRTIPPLSYSTVYSIKQDFPELEIVINGSIQTLEAMDGHLDRVDGVMIGRQAYSDPFLFAHVDQVYFHEKEQPLTPHGVLMRYLPYLTAQWEHGVSLPLLMRHLSGLFRHYPGSRQWRRFLHESAAKGREGIAAIEKEIMNHSERSLRQFV